MKSKNYEICQYLTISYVEAVVKKMSQFRTFCHPWCLEIETSSKKLHRVKKDDFAGKLTFKLEFDFKTFSTIQI
jgi:hypothetical protein